MLNGASVHDRIGVVKHNVHYFSTMCSPGLVPGAGVLIVEPFAWVDVFVPQCTCVRDPFSEFGSGCGVQDVTPTRWRRDMN